MNPTIRNNSSLVRCIVSQGLCQMDFLLTDCVSFAVVPENISQSFVNGYQLCVDWVWDISIPNGELYQ